MLILEKVEYTEKGTGNVRSVIPEYKSTYSQLLSCSTCNPYNTDCLRCLQYMYHSAVRPYIAADCECRSPAPIQSRVLLSPCCSSPCRHMRSARSNRYVLTRMASRSELLVLPARGPRRRRWGLPLYLQEGGSEDRRWDWGWAVPITMRTCSSTGASYI